VRPRTADQPARIRCSAKGTLAVRIEGPAGVVREADLGDGRITLSEAGGVSLWQTTPTRSATPPTPQR